MLSKEVNTILTIAVQEAQVRRHEYLSTEHVLFAILKDENGSAIINYCGVDIKRLEVKLESFLSKKFIIVQKSKEYVIQQTLSFQRLMQRAIANSQKEKHSKISICDILISMLHEKNSDVQNLLLSVGITKLNLAEYNLKNTTSEEAEERKKEQKKNYLKVFTTDLIEKASLGKIDNLIGREEEIERIIRVLSRRRKNNPILIGETGVGKTAIIEGIALKIFEDKLYSPFEIKHIYSLNLTKLIAGTKMRGDFEKRINQLLKILQEKEGAIFFIDEIHNIVGTGTSNNSSMDISNILKPILAEGTLRCIGATSFAEFKAFDKDKAFVRRFEKIEIKEPSIKESIIILKGLSHYYEKHHKTKYSEGVLRAATELSAKYISDRFLPDKAIDVIDEAGAFVNYNNRCQNNIVEISDIENIVAKMARIPSHSVSASDMDILEKLNKKLSACIFGQEQAITSLVNSLKRRRAGLVNYEKPIGSFLFAGPTGVGKTELAKQLAEKLGIKFIRFDMSEYMEKHSVSRFIGSPPGYVGFDQGGILTDKIRKNPYAVILFDEIEKAHFDIYNILLQIMDYASLTDNNGRKANFKNAIIIMSSNVGARQMTKSDIGFMDQVEKNLEKTGLKATEKLFSPEFRNRIDDNIIFKSLSLSVMEKIVDKFMGEIFEQGIEKKH